MKLVIFLTFICAIFAAPAADGPSQISSNNVGNIVNVDIEGNLKYNNQVNAVLFNFLLGWLQQQSLTVVAPAGPEQIHADPTEQIIVNKEVPKLTLEALKQALSKNH
jgi:hypothetical protein